MSYVEVVPVSAAARRRRILGKRFLRRPMAVMGLIVVLVFAVTAIFAPLIAPYSASHTDFNAILAHPSREHLLGTDELGRDIFSRLVYGSRAPLQAGPPAAPPSPAPRAP